jgi:hypothetical protein
MGTPRWPSRGPRAAVSSAATTRRQVGASEAMTDMGALELRTTASKRSRPEPACHHWYARTYVTVAARPDGLTRGD